MSSPIYQAFFTLAFAVLVIGLIFYFLKKYSNKINPNLNNNNIKILGKLSLTTKSHLFIIEIDNFKLLIGASEQSINLVKELDKKDNLDITDLPDQPTPQLNHSFKTFLKTALGKS